MTKFYKPIEVQLSNGIPVILQNLEGEVSTCYWWNQVGSTDESQQESGFAHFLEHMLFKDTTAKETGEASTGQLALAIESFGGDINAYTSFDQTVYHVTCADTHFENVLNAFGDLAKPQKFLKEDFSREREVILEELKKNEDSPSRVLFQELFTAAFERHPYGKPVIGFEKILKKATVLQLEKFYKKNYISSKMGIIIVGPIGEEKSTRFKNILKILEKKFGHRIIKKTSSAGASFKRIEEKILKPTMKWRMKNFDVQSPMFSCSFRAPDLNHIDVAPLDLLSSILGVGELSRLYQRLFYEESLVTDVSAGLYVPKDPGILYFDFEVDQVSKLKSAAQCLFEELRRIKLEGPTKEELERVKNHAESEKLYSTQTVDGLASRLGFMKFVVGNLNYDSHYLDEIRTIDLDHLKEAANTYLDLKRLSGAVLLPQNQKASPIKKEIESIVKIISNTKSPTLAKQKKEKELNKKTPELTQSKSGIKLVHYFRSQSPVFSMHISALGGLRLELADSIESPEKDWGSSCLLSNTWTKGTSRLSSKSIAAIFEGNSASFDGFSGRNTIGLQLVGLKKDFHKFKAAISEILVKPAFPKEELEHSKRLAEESIKTLPDHSGRLCQKLFLETLFENHPYGKTVTGSLESIAAIQAEKLKAFHEKWVKPKGLTISVSGGLEQEEIKNWLESLEVEWFASKNISSDIKYPKISDELSLKAPRWVEKNLKREQLHILVGSLGVTYKDDDRFALRLLQTLLGGQSGRLFIELREKRSLAYTVSPSMMEGIERGYVSTYIACAPNKRDEAIEEIQKVYEAIAKNGPTDEELKRAKQLYLGQKAMDLQGDASIAAYYGLEVVYGRNPKDDAELEKKIMNLSKSDLKQICEKYYLNQYKVSCIVG